MKIINFFRKKIIIKKIEKVDVLLLDNNFAKLKFNNLKYAAVNFDEINLWCLAICIRNFFSIFSKKISIKELYFKVLFELYSPKIVIDSNIRYWGWMCKKLFKKTKTIIYQHSFLYDYEKDDYKKIFANKESDFYVSFDKMHTNFFSSIIKSNFLQYGSVLNNEIILNKCEKIYPIMYISEFRGYISSNARGYDGKKKHYFGQLQAIKYLKTFCEKEKIKPQIGLMSYRQSVKSTGLRYEGQLIYNSEIYLQKEIRFYEENLKNFSYEKNSSIYTASKSNVIICLGSNLGIELLSRGFKVLFLNILGELDKKYTSPYFVEESCPCFVRNVNSKEVFDRINLFLKMSDSEWEKIFLNIKNKMFFDVGNSLLKKKINSIIKNRNLVN